MNTRFTVSTPDFTGPRSPLNKLLSNPSDSLIEFMKKTGSDIKNEIEDDMEKTTTSSTGQTPEQIKESAGYFASLLQVYIVKNPRVKPAIVITSRGTNSLAYENAHGHLVRGIARRRKF
jgi:hypothetical protein